MEKGKRLNKLLQPEVVDGTGKQLTGVVGVGGTVTGFFGGDPVRQRSSLLKAVITDCLSLCFPAVPCGSTALISDRCNQIEMLQNVQNMATSGQVGVPINPGMRDFMSKFAWANFGFLTPPPAWLTSVLVPAEFASPAAKRRRLNQAVAAGEDADNEAPPSDLPDPNESGNQGFLRKMGASADEFFIGA
eukprot:SAG22_NODE_739_length_7523_cov_6.844558_3_plen_189_part_00